MTYEKFSIVEKENKNLIKSIKKHGAGPNLLLTILINTIIANFLEFFMELRISLLDPDPDP